MRSLDRSVFFIDLLSNRYFNIAFLASMALQLLVIYTPFLRDAFRFQELPVMDLFIILLQSTSVIFGAEIYKYFRFRKYAADT